MAPEGLGNRLVPKTDPQAGDRAGDPPHELKASSRSFGATRPRRDQHAVNLVRSHSADLELVVLNDIALRIELQQVLNEIESERIVVVDDQEFVRKPRCPEFWLLRSFRVWHVPIH